MLIRHVGKYYFVITNEMETMVNYTYIKAYLQYF